MRRGVNVEVIAATRRGTMRISRREFVKSVTASGIALSVSRLAIAEEPGWYWPVSEVRGPF